ncbi:hypothetical protein C8R42DRAFT_686187 [Lentinula raphanica]|nr:hypothetical protein C8R42DRAFT_686187 [Lentinula raphanica]
MPNSQMIRSLAKSTADVVAAVVPVPGLSPAVAMVSSIIELMDNVTTNKHEARQLKDQCRSLLAVLSSRPVVENAHVNHGLKMIYKYVNTEIVR